MYNTYLTELTYSQQTILLSERAEKLQLKTIELPNTMYRVDFYVLNDQSSKEKFACALIQKIYKQGKKTFINTLSTSAAEAIDDKLWAFQDISFLPHALVTEENSKDLPIIIGEHKQTIQHIPAHCSIMLNLADEIPPIPDTIARVLEIVSGDQTERTKARKRYADYREQGHTLAKHTIETDYE